MKQFRGNKALSVMPTLLIGIGLINKSAEQVEAFVMQQVGRLDHTVWIPARANEHSKK
jgi:hypothetical protein